MRGLMRVIGTILVAVLTACSPDGRSSGDPEDPITPSLEAEHDEGRLGARPTTVDTSAQTGVLPLFGPDEGLLYVPASYRPDRPAPLAVSLHGCCGEAGSGLSLLRDFADRAGMLVVAPEGSGGSWDVLSGGFGPDVELIDAALLEVFATYSIDSRRVAISGFSDGASYALSLGLTNGDLFSHVIAHSPGFMSPGQLQGRPEVLIAHGREDRTLPFDNAERMVSDLKDSGYEVVFRPFDAGHKRQPQIFAEAVRWFTGR